MQEVSWKTGEVSVCIVGGAGFIGSHFADALLRRLETRQVTLFDNFSSGRERHFERHIRDERLRVVCGDAGDVCAGVGRLLYASGSGVYGERGETVLGEDFSPLQPVSTYGASKLAGEALIASYCAMFGMTACAFRFANVVGARQTHGVGFDFLGRLREDPTRLVILGDGKQSKSYVHVSDVVEAALLANARVESGFHVWNVATDDAVTVTEIAEMAAQTLRIDPLPRFEYTGGDRGWKGDVPVVRLDASRMKELGWRPRFNSREAVRWSLREMAAEFETEAVVHA